MTGMTVLDVSQGGVTACNRQPRFMDHAAPAVNGFSYQAFVRRQPDDTILANADGVIDSGEDWGVELISKAAAESTEREAEDMLDAVFMPLDEFSGGRQTGDATIAVLLVH